MLGIDGASVQCVFNGGWAQRLARHAGNDVVKGPAVGAQKLSSKRLCHRYVAEEPIPFKLRKCARPWILLLQQLG